MATSQHSANETFSQAITTDHKELKDYYNKIVAPGADTDTQERYKNAFAWELARHSIGEEIVIYPMFEKYMGDKGKQMADNDRAQHTEAKEILKQWQNMTPSDESFMPTLQKLWGALTQHMEEEENDDLPALEKAIGDHDECVKLGKSFARTKMFVPTRSHPSAPDKPPFETVAGLLAAPMDKLGDLFRKFPKDE